MKNKKINKIIFASFIFLILLIPLILSQNPFSSPMCTSGNCPLSDPNVQNTAETAYGVDLSNFPPGSTYDYTTQQVIGPNGKPILAPANQHPQGYKPSFGKGLATFSGPNQQLTTPQGTYPSTSGIAGADQTFTQAIGAVQGIFSLLGQLNLKELIAKKEKQDPGQPSGITDSPSFNEVKISQSRKETNTEFKGNSILTSDDKNTLVSSQKDASKSAELTTIGDSLKNSFVKNTATTVFSGDKPIAKVETNDKTEIVLDSTSKNDAFSQGTIISMIISLIQSNFISAQRETIETGQFVKFSEQDVEINGHDISVHALKTFEKVEAGGNNLEFYSGQNKFEFKEQKILFSRLLTNTPHGVNMLSNKLDLNNKYQLKHYTNAMGKLNDDANILFVTDITSKPGKGPYAKLTINRERMEMFS